VATALVTGSGGLVGSEAVRCFHQLGWDVVGIDNDLRASFFGAEASTRWVSERLVRELPGFVHEDVDVRDADAVERVVRRLAGSLSLVIHTAAQPSHDWAAQDPVTDFDVNARGTLVLLEAVRRHAPSAAFVFLSTNKVYGDTPNQLPFLEFDTRFELPERHEWHGGIPETMSIDRSTHSLFGVSKAAADLLVQEYGRYFGLATVSFRAGCITGPWHAGAELHGFLAYLMKCAATGRPYRVYGYGGKQVRDNIHSADLVAAFEQVAARPKPGAVYNIGGGRFANCSLLEAIAACERITGHSLDRTYVDEPRTGDHIWWISDLTAFRMDYPQWSLRYDIDGMLEEMYERNGDRWLAERAAS